MAAAIPKVRRRRSQAREEDSAWICDGDGVVEEERLVGDGDKTGEASA
jgi:hypothetical protein